jgi:hypothetical protein
MPTTSEEKVTRDSAVVPFQTPNLNPVRLDAVAAKRSGPETTGFKKRNALVVCIAILRSQGVGGTIRAGAYLHAKWKDKVAVSTFRLWAIEKIPKALRNSFSSAFQ